MHLGPPGLAEEVRRAECRFARPPCPEPPAGLGLGDFVATLAQPIARVSDAVLGTKLVGCSSCAERQAALNRIRLG